MIDRPFAYQPLICRNCGDDFTAPERPCPKPSPGRPYQECGRGGHMFFPVQPEPHRPLTAKRLREIRKLTARRGLLASAIDDLLADRDRLLAECKRLQRVGLESARVGGDPVFTRDQIERICAEPRRKRAA